MVRSIAAAFVFIILTSTVQAMGADEIATVPATTADIRWTAASVTAGPAAEALVNPVNATSQSMSFLRSPEPSSRGTLLPALYVGLASLNAYDAHATVKGIASGAREANGIMRLTGGSPVAIWAVKGGVTAATILTAEHLWRTHRRGQAIGMMLATNGLMAIVGARNNSVLRSQR
jgi:hypothetical protein